MPRTLIVLAHPDRQSLAHALAEHARVELSATGHEVETLDLYALGFEPRLSVAERHADKASSQTHGPETWALVEKVRAADNLVFVFPTWWFGPPAMMKGFIDRVFVPGAAFDRAPDDGPIKPLLERLKQVVLITTLGSPWWVDRLVMWQPIYRTFRLGIIGGCAPKARTRYLALYSAESVRPARVDRFRARVSKVLRSL